VLPEAEHTHVHSVLEDLKAAGRVAGELTVRAAAADAEGVQVDGELLPPPPKKPKQ